MDINLITTDDLKEIVIKLDRIEKAIIEKPKQSPLGAEWLDNSDVCKLLRISKRTLYNWRMEGLIEYSQHESKIWYKATSIAQFLEKNSHKPFKLQRKFFK